MATVEVDGRGVQVRLGLWERLGAFHGDVEAAPECLVGAIAVPDLWAHLRGVRAPGTGLPGVIMLGTTRHDGAKDFCVVYRRGPGLVVDLRGHEFARLLVSVPADRAVRLATSVTDLVGLGS